jgi:hypothetical protein
LVFPCDFLVSLRSEQREGPLQKSSSTRRDHLLPSQLTHRQVIHRLEECALLSSPTLRPLFSHLTILRPTSAQTPWEIPDLRIAPSSSFLHKAIPIPVHRHRYSPSHVFLHGLNHYSLVGLNQSDPKLSSIHLTVDLQWLQSNPRPPCRATCLVYHPTYPKLKCKKSIRYERHHFPRHCLLILMLNPP